MFACLSARYHHLSTFVFSLLLHWVVWRWGVEVLLTRIGIIASSSAARTLTLFSRGVVR
jgi:hypothetical protein